MQDTFQRAIDYMRISITDRCNLRCTYCMPEDGVPLVEHEEILSFEELERVVGVAAQLGIRRIRLTGGEPLVRKGLTAFVSNISKISGIEDIALTTNGVLLPKLARGLRKAGVSRLNISIDSLKPERFKAVTRVGRLEDVLAGMQIAIKEGFQPVKLNVVVMGGINDDELVDFARLTYQWPLHVRFIELMPIGEGDAQFHGKFVSVEEMKKQIAVLGSLEPRIDIKGAGPAQYYNLQRSMGSIGFISAISSHFCHKCNRLRLTAEGKLRPCLHGRMEVDVKRALRSGASDEEIKSIFTEAICSKPKQHAMVEEGWGQQSRIMSQIGG